MIDRQCGKTNKKNEEEFVDYVDFIENLKQRLHSKQNPICVSFSLKNVF